MGSQDDALSKKLKIFEHTLVDKIDKINNSYTLRTRTKAPLIQS